MGTSFKTKKLRFHPSYRRLQNIDLHYLSNYFFVFYLIQSQCQSLNLISQNSKQATVAQINLYQLNINVRT